MAACELESNIRNVNLNQNKKKLFLCFNNSHANQTNTAKKIWFFSYIVNINENLKKTDEKKCLKSVYKYSHISWSNTGNYVVETCNQKFHLRVRFITRLNTFGRVWVRTRAIARLSWKGLKRFSIK